ncbi:MAG: Hsp20/alpha crystallin family protein [Desulfobacter sp.]
MRLVRYNPLNEMSFFRNAFDDFFNDTSRSRKPASWYPAVDIVSKDDSVEVSVELPGMKKEDISVNIEDKVLTISGERKSETEETTETYHRRERWCGSFKRAFTLSNDIMVDEITADYVDGILKVTLKKEPATETVKQITVN